MRRIIYLLFAVALMMQPSCKKILEKELPEHELSADVAIVDQKSALVALNGVYAYLQYDYDKSSTYTASFSYEFAINGAQMGGLLAGGQRFTFDRSLRTFDVVPIDNGLPSFYRLLYRMVNAANNVIFYTNRLPTDKITSEKKAEIIAEARFLRGFAHFWFLKYHGYFWDIESQFGPILRLEPTTISNLMVPRTSVREGYLSIIADYENCIQNGPEKHTSVFKVCRTTAKAFKAEALMMRGAGTDYADALQLANEVINSTEFKMEATFEAVFSPLNDYKPNRETMFSRALNKETVTNSLANPLVQSPYGVFSYAVGNTANVYSEGTEGGAYYSSIIRPDARYKYTWGLDSVTTGNPPVKKVGVSFKKVWRYDANCPSYIMRLAQLYLIKAEAMAQTGSPTSDVLVPLNYLRIRSGNTALIAASFPDKPSLLAAIVNEYVLELGVENASEWFAMVRIKDAGGTRLVAKFNTFYQNEAQLCLPIPNDDILTNKGILVQNPSFKR